MAKASKKKATEFRLVGAEDLNEIAQQLLNQVPQLPEIPNISNIDLSERIRVISEEAVKVEAGVASVVKFLVSVQRELAKYQGNAPAQRLAQRVILADNKKSVGEMNEYLERMFTFPETILVGVAVVAYIKATLSQAFQNFQQVHDALKELENRELIVWTPSDSVQKGPLSIGYKWYKMNDKFGLEAADIDLLTGVIERFSQTFRRLVNEQRKEQRKDAREEANLLLEDGLKGGVGKCLFGVPYEFYLDADKKEQRRPGGDLLVEFRQKEIVPLTGIGAMEHAVARMVQSKVVLYRHDLEANDPPSYIVAKARAVRQGLNDQDAGEYANSTRALWYFFKRGLKGLRAEQEQAQQREEFRGRATVSAIQAFGLDGNESDGVVCLEHRGAFKQKQGKPAIYGLFFIAKFSNETGERTVQVVDVPERFQKQLAAFVGKPYLVGGNFKKCPSFLRQALQEIFGQVSHENEIQKATQASPEAETA